MQTKIGTLNLCLGLSNKKDLVKKMIIDEKIDILCLQETELEINVDQNLMSFNGFFYESENNNVRSRVGCYVNTNLSYIRRLELEGQNSHLVILDIMGPSPLRIINMYRCFKPQNNISAMEFFKHQVELIHSAYNDNTIILGDINLDWAKKGQRNYQFQNYFEYMDEKFSDRELMQLVDFPTWSRTVNGVLKESILDHIYTQDPI
jgi:endonuclease/exonuclease/phosphatase family metal-dependent hydrolase